MGKKSTRIHKKKTSKCKIKEHQTNIIKTIKTNDSLKNNNKSFAIKQNKIKLSSNEQNKQQNNETFNLNANKGTLNTELLENKENYEEFSGHNKVDSAIKSPCLVNNFINDLHEEIFSSNKETKSQLYMLEDTILYALMNLKNDKMKNEFLNWIETSLSNAESLQMEEYMYTLKDSYIEKYRKKITKTQKKEKKQKKSYKSNSKKPRLISQDKKNTSESGQKYIIKQKDNKKLDKNIKQGHEYLKKKPACHNRQNKKLKNNLESLKKGKQNLFEKPEKQYILKEKVNRETYKKINKDGAYQNCNNDLENNKKCILDSNSKKTLFNINSNKNAVNNNIKDTNKRNNHWQRSVLAHINIFS